VWRVNPDFDAFQLSDSHRQLRAAVRELAEAQIEPYAADVDEKARYPQEAHDALVASDFFAPHVPEEYGGAGADAFAVCIIIEEISPVCASSSLIPAVNKLGSMPLILAASEDLKHRYLTPLAEGKSGFSYGLSEREAGSDTVGNDLHGDRAAGRVVDPQRPQGVDHQRGCQRTSTRCSPSPTPTGAAAPTISAFVVEKSDPGFTFSEKERKLGIKGSPTRELWFDNCTHPRRPDDRRSR
jgi:alkylation response protein AidB-like acyl-CoA dehydrogenase